MNYHRLQSLNDGAEAISIGLSVTQALTLQEEQLQSSTHMLVRHEHMLIRAKRMVRGMTWLGSIVNMLSSDPQPPRASDQSAPNSVPPTAFHAPRISREGAYDSDECSVHAQMRAQDAYLEQQMQSVEQLHALGMSIAGSLGHQNSQLQEIHARSDRIVDKSREVVRMQGQIANSVRGNPKLKGIFALRDEQGRSIRVVGAGHEVRATLMPGDQPLSAKWEAWCCDDGVCGFRSCQTKLWLGQRIRGDIKAKATTFSSWESW
jgi:hypothetical protein